MGTMVELPERSRTELHALAHRAGLSDAEALRIVLEAVFEPIASHESVMPLEELRRILAASLGGMPTDIVRSSPEILGGDHRIRDTRIPVWLLVAHKKWGETDAEILQQYPGLTGSDLLAAWEFYAANTERVDNERRANEAAE